MDTSINVVESVLIDNITSNSMFKIFCEDIDKLHSLLDINYTNISDDTYIEAVTGVGNRGRLQKEKILKNTADTTKSTAKVWNITTDAGGSLLKSGYMLLMKFLTICAKIIKFVVLKIVKIPELIMELLDKIEKLPSNIKAKIRGDIKLYITANDLVALYSNDGLMLHLMTFINLCETLTSGTMWTTFMGNIKEATTNSKFDFDAVFKITDNDIKTCKKMEKEYLRFNKLKFSQTIVDMSNKNNVELYFGNSKIEIVDISGGRRSDTYLGTMRRLISDINFRKNILSGIERDISEKFITSQENLSFAQLSQGKMARITKSVEMVSKAVELVGSIVKYIMADIDTINKAANQLLSRKEAIDSGNTKPKKRLIGINDEVVQNAELSDDIKSSAELSKKLKDGGYIRVEKYIRDSNGDIIETIDGVDDPANNEYTWIKANKFNKKKMTKV